MLAKADLDLGIWQCRLKRTKTKPKLSYAQAQITMKLYIRLFVCCNPECSLITKLFSSCAEHASNTFLTTISIKLHVGLVGGRFRHSKGVVPFSTMLTKCILGINTNKHVLYGVGCSSSLGARRWSVHSFFRSKGEFASNPVCRPQVFFCPITWWTLIIRAGRPAVEVEGVSNVINVKTTTNKDDEDNGSK